MLWFIFCEYLLILLFHRFSTQVFSFDKKYFQSFINMQNEICLKVETEYTSIMNEIRLF